MRNKIFQEILNEKNLSIKEASKILKVSPFILKDYRDGYRLLDDKKVIEFSEKLNFDPNRILIDKLNYPEAIELENDKNKVLDFLKRFFSSVYTLLFSLILVIISCLIIPFSKITIDDIQSNPLKRYNSDFISLNNQIREKEDITLMPLINAIDCPTAYQDVTTFNEDDEKLTLLIATDEKIVDLFTYRFLIESTEEKIDFLNLNDDTTFYVDYYYSYQDKEYNLYCDYLKEGQFVDVQINELHNHKSLKEDSELYKIGKENLYKIFNTINSRFTTVLKQKFNIDSDFVAFSSNFLSDMSNVTKTKNNSYFMLIVFSLFLFLFGAILILVASSLTIKRFKFNIVDEAFKDNKIIYESNLINDNKLKRNIKFGPELRSGLLRIIGLILLFLGNSTIFILFISLIKPNIFETISSFPYQEIFGAFKFISTFLLTFILIDLTRKNKNMFIKAIAFLFGGCAFYITEIIAIDFLTHQGLLASLIAEFMPLNILWSTGIYVFLAIFLFTTPKFCNKKRKIITFRLLSLIPLAFLITSELLSIFNNLDIIELEKYLHGLFIHKSFGLSIFIIIYIYSIYFYELHLKNRYNFKEYSTYTHGNKYAWIRNIFACLALLISYLIVYSLSFISNDFLKDFNQIKYVIILIPFLLLYRPRIPKENVIQNILYGIGLITSSILPYILSYLVLL